MLDNFTIATRGGVVLWSKDYAPVSGTPINRLVQDVLIQGTRTDTTNTSNASKYITGPYSLQWAFANELNVIFIAVYQKILQLPYVEDLLRHVKKHFVTRFKEELRQLADGSDPESPDFFDFSEFSQFDSTFEQVWNAVIERDTQDRQNKTRQPRKFENTKKYLSTAEGAQRELQPQSSSDPTDLGSSVSQHKGTKMRKWADKHNSGGNEDEKSSPKKGKKKGKKNRVWDDQVTADDMKALDYSGGSGKTSPSASHQQSRLIDEQSMGVRTADGIYEVADVAERSSGSDGSDSFVLLEDDDGDGQSGGSGSSAGGIFGIFKSLTNGRVLTAESLSDPISRMREHLANKNVASDIADDICQSVSKGMVGVRVGGFQNIRKLVEQNMEIALTRILTPVSSTDIIRDIDSARAQNRPYTMVFVGVNGVGKSTNLSKVCYWLLQNNKRVLIAACDTFRSGAVEQLRVHVRNLKALSENQNVEIFERGYGKDSASIAKDAIAFGASNDFDVVLIDTAGRMQDNEPLMRALSKLVNVNSPDKILFVGEALVGNEAIDQLEKFNRAMSDFSNSSRPRHIDGIILTKFDTIDDRVGAALSMTYITGQPIVFVGTGQTYTDLRKMNVSQVVRALLRN